MAIEDTVATASTYDPTLREINADTDTVQGQITGLLDSDSQYMTRARARGTNVANSRGLLNSSLAAGASEASAIDAALPIAQQDAGSYLQQGLANQSASNTAGSTNAQIKTNVSTTNAANATGLEQTRMGEAGALERTNITEAGALERLGISEAGAMSRLETSEAGAMSRLETSEAGATSRLTISEAGALERANISANASIRSASIHASATAAAAKSSAAASMYAQDQATIRNDATIAANQALSDDRINQENINGYATAYTNIGVTATSERNAIMNNPDMGVTERQAALAVINDHEAQQRIDIAPIYGVEVNLDSSDTVDTSVHQSGFNMNINA